MNKQPEVTARTRQQFIDAFWSACETKRPTQITVGELARQAGHNRSTFYEYFTDIPDLIQQLEDGILTDIEIDLAEVTAVLADGSVPQFSNIFGILSRLLNQKAYYLLGPNGDPTFAPRLREKLLPQIRAFMGPAGESERFDYIVAYAYSAIIGYLQYWFEQGQSLSVDEVCQLGYELMTSGVVNVAIQDRNNAQSNG